MPYELWFAFAVASGVVLAVPGPTVMLVVSYALGQGKSTGWATVPGVILGDFSAMTASLLGAGAILAASAQLFMALKLFGAAYLVWLGVKLWRAKPKLDHLENTSAHKTHKAMFWNAYVITALNPKGIVFFVAFVPQFIDPLTAPLMQFVILEGTFLTLATVNITIWALLAGHLRAQFKRPETLKWVNRAGGSFLIGAGLLTAALKRANA